MLTLDDLRSRTIDAETAREALEQSHRRLSDAIDTKKAYEQKASTFFSVYVAICLTLFGVAATLFKEEGLTLRVGAFLFVGVFFLVGALLFVDALWHREYGTLGSQPDFWLLDGVIDGDSHTLATMRAYLASYHFKRISISDRHNDLKRLRIAQGVLLGAFAPLLLVVLLLLAAD
jgi:hypothetical protein